MTQSFDPDSDQTVKVRRFREPVREPVRGPRRPRPEPLPLRTHPFMWGFWVTLGAVAAGATVVLFLQIAERLLEVWP